MSYLNPQELDAQIKEAELRLMAREENLRLQFNQVSRRIKRASRMSSWAKPVLGIAATVLTTWWLQKRRKPHARHQHAAGMSQGQGRSGAQWMQLVSLALPFLPATLRSKLNPPTASSLLSIGIPWMERMIAQSKAGAPLETVASVELERYAGTWYEIARLPEPFESACAGQPSATYTVNGDQLDVENRCAAANGSERVALGVAQPVPESGNAKLKVTFLPAWLRWLPFGWGDYWVLYVDPGYTVALVGNPKRNFMWILARQRRISEGQLQHLLVMAKERGFAIERLEFPKPE